PSTSVTTAGASAPAAAAAASRQAAANAPASIEFGAPSRIPSDTMRAIWSRQFVSAMSEPYSCAVLFADISGSTRLYEELGDSQALSRIDRCLRLLRDAAVEFGGRVVKTTGDGVMCSFEQAEPALHAARFMQPPLAIHIGCQYGPVLESEGDLYGDCVNVAVRVVGLAKAGQVLATQEIVGR